MKILAPITENADIPSKKYVDDSIPSLTNYVTNTDYADSNTGGVIKTSSSYYGLDMSSTGYLKGVTKTYSEYSSARSDCIISKGTLDNVIAQAITTALNTPV